MGFQRPEGGWRFNFGGLKTNTAADEMPPGKYPFVKNVRYVQSLQTRPGYELLIDTNPAPPAGCVAGLSWSTEFDATLTNWNGIVYAPEITLLVGFGGLAGTNYTITSPDGLVWTSHNLGVLGYSMLAMAWSPSLARFVVVGDGKVQTSPDGVVWTSRTPSDTYTWSAVCWSSTLNLFVAAGYDGTTTFLPYFMTSPDGISWTTRSTPGSTNQFYNRVLWIAALSLFVAVGNDAGGTNHHVMTSPDGTTWTNQTTPANDNLWNGVAYSPTLGLIVAVGQIGSGTDNRTMHSSDAITWVLGTTPASTPGNGFYMDIAWSSTLALFVAVGLDDGTGSFAGVLSHSLDGITFILDTIPVASGGWNGVAAIDPTAAVVAVGNNEVAGGLQGQLYGVCSA